MNCQETKELFVDALYGELEETQRARFDEHLAGCAACSGEYRGLQATLAVMSRREVPEPDDAFMDRYWERLNGRIETAPENAPVQRKVIPFPAMIIPRWAYGIAAIILIALGVYIGRMLPGAGDAALLRQDPVAAKDADADTARPALDREVEEYLDRSRTLLLGMVNNEESSPAIVKHQQQRSRELIQEAVYLKTALNGPDDTSIRKLIEDLEIVLLQLANYSNDTGIPIVELVRQGVDQKSILLKINIEQIRALGPGGSARTKAAEQSRQSGT